MDLSQYSAMETMRDGRPLEIRALQPADRDGLRGALDRMSDETIRRRFFGLKRHFDEKEVAYYTEVDFVDHVALVAVVEEDGRPIVVGGARYIVSRPGAAEVAFAVDDAHQGHGIGRLLMRHLVEIAGRAGVAELYAEVLPENTAMLRVFERSGLTASKRREGGVVVVTLRVG